MDTLRKHRRQHSKSRPPSCLTHSPSQSHTRLIRSTVAEAATHPNKVATGPRSKVATTSSSSPCTSNRSTSSSHTSKARHREAEGEEEAGRGVLRGASRRCVAVSCARRGAIVVLILRSVVKRWDEKRVWAEGGLRGARMRGRDGGRREEGRSGER